MISDRIDSALNRLRSIDGILVSATLNKMTEVYDVSSGVNIRTVSTTELECIEDRFRSDEVDGSKVLSTDLKLLAISDLGSVEYDAADTVSYIGREFEIVSIMPIKYGSSTKMSIIHLRA